MKTTHYLMAFCLAICGISTNALSAELVQKFTGSNSTETAEFEVQAPWLLDWIVNGDYPQMLAIEVSLIDAVTGTHEGYVLKTKFAGDGVRLFNQSGRFRLRVDATLTDWVLKVEQLTRAEAEQYTPVKKN